ncbi:hypothetical protein V8F33_007397 [Rhypophila sp. PSN 637]
MNTTNAQLEAQASGPTDTVQIYEPVSRPTRYIAQVRKCGVAHFKNRFGPNEPLYAVDVLENDSTDISLHIQEEAKLRQSIPRKRSRDRVGTGLGASLNASLTGVNHGFHFGHSRRMYVLRIRIQDPALLAILCKNIADPEEIWDTKPRTFIRPFSDLIFNHSKIRKELHALEERWGTQDTLDPGHGQHAGNRTPNSVADTASEYDAGNGGGRYEVDDSPAALEALRCYVKFMDEEVMTFYTKFDRLSEVTTPNGTPPKVRFHDLWYLFRIGELIYRPLGTGANKELDNTSLGKRTWRCYATRPPWGRYRDRIVPAEHRSYRGEDDVSERSSFGVHCYYIDFTGDEFCVVTETFEIPFFKGERSIKSLPVCPYRFAAGHQKLLRAALENGHTFLRSIKTQHAAYTGWTTTLTPKGKPTTDVEGNELKRPEFIDSEVIVDFPEAFQTCPAWKPEATIVKLAEPLSEAVDDDFSICWWSDGDRSKLLRETNEIIVLATGISAYERNNNLNPENPRADRFLIRTRENDRDRKPTTENDLCHDEDDFNRCDLLLLPTRIFGYVLRDRKFVQLVVQRLGEVKKSNDAFEYLKINTDHKNMIQSLVEQHFESKTNDREQGVESSSFDLIKGKGKGLFILLHGVPGVGKTATAEAIAAANGRPLFPITCGDLGLTPTAVEAALLRIFRLADNWNCVLLLDEVDTFLSQRARGDTTLAKNALVSVFLRVLEYYDGVLLMTTNRTGALDEAFESRIHLKLYYPDLDLRQTMDIWAMNIRRLEKVEEERAKTSKGIVQPLGISTTGILEFAHEAFQSQKENRWNGRQIRNAFQVAASLARYEARKDDRPPKMTVKHFRKIYNVTEDFDRFMYETRGKTPAGMAFERGDRAIHYVSRRDHGAVDHESYRDIKNGDRSPRPRLDYDNEDIGPRRRQSSFNNNRPVSPNLMSLPSERDDRGRAIFGSKAAQGLPSVSPRPRHRPSSSREHNLNPQIEITHGGEDRPSSREWTRLFPDRDRSDDEDRDYLSTQYGGQRIGRGDGGRSSVGTRMQKRRDREFESDDDMQHQRLMKPKRLRDGSDHESEDKSD